MRCGTWVYGGQCVCEDTYFTVWHSDFALQRTRKYVFSTLQIKKTIQTLELPQLYFVVFTGLVFLRYLHTLGFLTPLVLMLVM